MKKEIDFNIRDGIYIGTFLGFIFNFFFLKYLNKVMLQEQISAQAYYDEEFPKEAL